MKRSALVRVRNRPRILIDMAASLPSDTPFVTRTVRVSSTTGAEVGMWCHGGRSFGVRAPVCGLGAFGLGGQLSLVFLQKLCDEGLTVLTLLDLGGFALFLGVVLLASGCCGFDGDTQVLR